MKTDRRSRKARPSLESLDGRVLLSWYDPTTWGVFKPASIPIATKPAVTTTHIYSSGVQYCADTGTPTDCSVLTTAAVRTNNTIHLDMQVHDTTLFTTFYGDTQVNVRMTNGATFHYNTFYSSYVYGNFWLTPGSSHAENGEDLLLPRGYSYANVAGVSFTNHAVGPAYHSSGTGGTSTSTTNV